MEAKHEEELAALESKLADAKENYGDTEVRDALIAKAQLFCRIGDIVRHKPHFPLLFHLFLFLLLLLLLLYLLLLLQRWCCCSGGAAAVGAAGLQSVNPRLYRGDVESFKETSLLLCLSLSLLSPRP